MNLAQFLQKVTSIFSYFIGSNFFLVIFSGLFAIAVLFATVRLIRYILGKEF